MADLGLVKQLMDAGLDRNAATAQVEAVTSAIVAQLRSDKAVTLPGVGVLRAPETTHAAPHPRSKLRKERRATLRRGPHLGGKLIGSEGRTDHWSGDLNVMLIEELGDLAAAMEFFVAVNDLDRAAIGARRDRKVELFDRWHRDAMAARSQGYGA